MDITKTTKHTVIECSEVIEALKQFKVSDINDTIGTKEVLDIMEKFSATLKSRLARKQKMEKRGHGHTRC